MSTEYRVVPVELTEEMLDVLHDTVRIKVDMAERTASIINDKEWWAAMLAAAPVPPAGGEPEVVGYLRATAEGKTVWDEDCVCEDPVYPNFDGDESVSMPMIRQSDHRARVIRLQAEVERLTENNEAFIVECVTRGNANVSLQSELATERLRADNDYEMRLIAESELAKTREAFTKLRDVARECEHLASSFCGSIDGVEEHGGDDHEDPTCAIWHRLYYAMFEADQALSHQSAPAAKDGE